MNVEHVHFETGSTVTAIDFLVGGEWWMRGGEWVGKREEDDVLD